MQVTDTTVARLRSVHKRYGELKALDGVDLQLQPGQLLALLGPNGAGKTAAIGLLLGMATADAGEATLFGLPPQQLAARRHIGVMLQSAGIPDTLQVGELLQLTRSYYQDPRRSGSSAFRTPRAGPALRRRRDDRGGRCRSRRRRPGAPTSAAAAGNAPGTALR